MSQTTSLQDQFLATEGAKVPAQQAPLAVNPQFGNIRMTTPVARGAYITVDTPRSVPGSNDPIRRYSATLLLNPAACTDLYQAICMVADARWPKEARPNPQNPQQMIEVSGHDLLFWPKEAGGLHYPLRQGDQLYVRDPKKYGPFQGCFTINASLAEKTRKGVEQKPVLIDENGQAANPSMFYSGCYVRAQITIGAFPQPGQQIPNRGISVTLNALQFISHGQKLSGFDGLSAATAAFAAAGPTGKSGYTPEPGFGVNQVTANSVPPGTPFGFAAPPSAQTAQQPAASVQPQFAGARPPGA